MPDSIEWIAISVSVVVVVALMIWVNLSERKAFKRSIAQADGSPDALTAKRLEEP